LIMNNLFVEQLSFLCDVTKLDISQTGQVNQIQNR